MYKTNLTFETFYERQEFENITPKISYVINAHRP